MPQTLELKGVDTDSSSQNLTLLCSAGVASHAPAYLSPSSPSAAASDTTGTQTSKGKRGSPNREGHGPDCKMWSCLHVSGTFLPQIPSEQARANGCSPRIPEG